MAYDNLFDLEIDSSGDIEFGPNNDASTVTGTENIMQSTGIIVRNITAVETSNRITKTRVEKIRGKIADHLRQYEPQITTEWLEVQLTDIGQNEATFEVFVEADESFVLEVPLDEETI